MIKKLLKAIREFFVGIFSKAEPTETIKEIIEMETEGFEMSDERPKSVSDLGIVIPEPMDQELILTARNKSNSVFYVRPKSDFEKEMFSDGRKGPARPKNYVAPIHPFEGFREEHEIIELMNIGFTFWTFNLEAREFTPVRVSKGKHLVSKKNRSKTDNISSLPIREKSGD
jgi:hypothetical protein